VRQKLLIVTQGLRLPSICILCNQFHKGLLAVCSPCIDLLPQLGIACQHCAYPLPNTDYLVCGHCIKKQPYFDRVLITYQFEEPIRTLLHRFKYHNGLYLASFFSHLIINSVHHVHNKPQCLIPVPMHPHRIKQRGFNHAAILAKSVSKKLEIPCHLNTCQKMINTAPQASLNQKQRHKNLHQAFKAQPLPYHHVALIDDLFTTGSTANELALTLKNKGVEQIDVWCCARTVAKN
jgi:ComF family protein